MADIIQATFIPEALTGLGAFPEMDTVSGTFGVTPVRGATIILAGYVPKIVVSALNSCLFTQVSTTTALPRDADPPFPPVWPYLFSTAVIYGRDHLSVNLKIVRGDDVTFNIAVTLDGAAVDLTGATLRMTAKWRYTDADGSAVFTRTSPSSGITITNATGGLASVNIVPANTNTLPAHEVRLVYDIQMTDASSKPTTVMSGTFIVVPDVSVTTP